MHAHQTTLRLAICLGGLWVFQASAVSPAMAGDWDAELSLGLLLFDPRVERIPRGTSDDAVDALVEVGVGRRVVDRLRAHVSLGHARGTDTEWTSGSDGGTARIPTPSVTTMFAGLELPLVAARVVPFAGIGAGVTVFSSVDEKILFDWGTHTTTNRVNIEQETDATILFDVGARAALGGRLEGVVRYRFLSVFSGEHVDTLDRITLAARLGL